MSLRETPVEAVRVEMFCDECGGLMKPTGWAQPAAPMRYPHKCEQGHQVTVLKVYPCVEHRVSAPPPTPS